MRLGHGLSKQDRGKNLRCIFIHKLLGKVVRDALDAGFPTLQTGRLSGLNKALDLVFLTFGAYETIRSATRQTTTRSTKSSGLCRWIRFAACSCHSHARVICGLLAGSPVGLVRLSSLPCEFSLCLLFRCMLIDYRGHVDVWGKTGFLKSAEEPS